MREHKILFAIVSVCAVIHMAKAFDDGCTEPLSPEQQADHWVACEGEGKSKDDAINNAIKRGISMVYGEVMSAADKAETHVSDSSVSVDGKAVSVEETHESFDSSMATKTAGFVREYKVISAVQENGGYKAHIHARIVNPRAGVDGVILVMRPEASVELKSELIKVGPSKTLSGKEVCGATEAALCGALSGSKHFRICTEKDIAAAVANGKLTSSLAQAGLVPSSELLQAGQMLTCDYILLTRVESISYTKKLGQDKKTKKFGQLQTMKVKMALQLTNVRTGTSAANDTLTLTLDDAAIKEMLAEDEDADLLQGAFGQMVGPLRGWIKKSAK